MIVLSRALADLFNRLGAGTFKETDARRSLAALDGRPVGLRPHEIFSLEVPERIECAELGPGGRIAVTGRDHRYEYANPFLSPAVVPGAGSKNAEQGPSLKDLLQESLSGRETLIFPRGSVAIARAGDRKERCEPDGPPFAHIQRDTVRLTADGATYVGWGYFDRSEWGTVKSDPTLVTPNGTTLLAEKDSYPNVLVDGDDLAVLSMELVTIGDPEPESLFRPGNDGKRRDTCVRFLGDDPSIKALVVRDSAPSDWKFIARTSRHLILSGGRRVSLDHAPPERMATVIDLHTGETIMSSAHADDASLKAFGQLTGKARRVGTSVVVESNHRADGTRFVWLHEDGEHSFPLYGDLERLIHTGPKTLMGWHTDGGRTLFVSRYDRE